ncbi:MAG: TldD/PmbA family protein [Dehalococcoidia bacterium]
MESILDKVKGSAEEAEVFSVAHHNTEVMFEANRLKLVQTKESRGTALRVIKNGHMGLAATNKSGDEQELPDKALEMAPYGVEAKFSFPKPQVYPSVSTFDPEVESVSEEKLVEIGQALIDRVRASNPDLLCEASVHRGTASVQIMNSNGGMAEYRESVFSIAVEGVLIKGTDMLFVGDQESSCHPVLTSDNVVKSTLQQLERARNTTSISTGSMPVIFTALGVAAVLLEPLLVAFNGKTVLRGASPLGKRKGEQVFTPDLSIWDDGTIDFCPAASICDDEGVPSRRTPLIDKGVVSNFLYDLQTAAEAGAESTGSATRSLASLPSPSSSAVIVNEGQMSFADMLAEIKEGLIVEEVMGAGQGNVLGGDFSGNVLLGYKVENGEIVGRVKNTMISGNVYDVFKEGVAFGSDSRWIGGSLNTPSVYCPRVSVAATG